MSSSESTTESSAKEGESLQRSEAKNDVKNKTYHKAVMKAIKTLTEEKGKRPKGESRKKYTRALRLAERWCIVLQLTSRAEFDKARSIFKPANIEQLLLQRPSCRSEHEKLVKELANADEYDSDVKDGKAALVVAGLLGKAFDVLVKINQDLMADTELNEWTLICRTIVLLIEEYITLCCPDVLRVHYDKAEEKGRIQPDLQLILKHAQSPKVLLCEVALEELDLSSTDFTQSHKDAMKLPTFMRDQLEKQLQILPPQNAGVFGILMGKLVFYSVTP